MFKLYKKQYGKFSFYFNLFLSIGTQIKGLKDGIVSGSCPTQLNVKIPKIRIPSLSSLTQLTSPERNPDILLIGELVLLHTIIADSINILSKRLTY